MAYCEFPDNDARGAQEATELLETGHCGGDYRFRQSAGEDARIAQEFLTDAQAKAEAEQALVDGIASGSIQPGYRLPEGIWKELKKLPLKAQRVRMIERRAAQERQLAENERMLNRLNQTAEAKSGWWLRIVNGLNEKFVDSNSSLAKYFLNLFPENGRNAENNIGVSIVNSSLSNILGFARYLNRMMQKIHDDAGKLCAKLPDVDAGDFLHRVGNLINYRQAESRNSHLIKLWREDARRARAEAAEHALGSSRHEELMRTAAHHEANARILEENRHLREQPKDGKKIVCCGYLDGEAKWLEAEDLAWLRSKGFDPSVVDTFYDKLYYVYDKAENVLIQTGQISESQIRRMPDIKGFLPFTPYMDNLAESMSNIDVYQPGSWRAMQGMTEHPASAWHSMSHFVNRAAYRAGGVDLAQVLYNAWRTKGDKSGIRIRQWGNVNQLGLIDFNEYLRVTSSDYGGGGIVADVIVDGAGTRKKTFIQFDQHLLDDAAGKGVHSAKQLNQILGNMGKSADKIGILGKATGYMGQSYTKLTAGFAPMNGIRDLGERVVNMINRDYATADGKHLPGYKLTASVLANVTTSMRTLLDAVRGRLDPNTEYGRYHAEYLQQGCDPVFTRDLGTNNKGLESAISDESPSRLPDNIKAVLKAAGPYAKPVGNFIEAWNSYFNNIAPFAQFIAMRKNGMSAKAAGNAVNEMLNNNIGGTALNMMRTFFPFARPTMQGARAMLRTMGLGVDASGKWRKPDLRTAATVLGTYAAGSMFYGFIRDSLGEDESGALNADALSVGQIAASLPIPTSDGHYWRAPVPFGVPRIALAMAVAEDRVQRGVMDVDEGMFAVMAQVAKNVSSQDFPEYAAKENPAAWLAQAFSPIWARPVADVAVNRNFMGRPISYKAGGGEEGMEPKAASGYGATAPFYKDAAKLVLETTGVDLAPEQVQAIARGYLGGFLRGVTTYVESDNPAVQEERKTANQEMGPLLTMLGATMYYGRQLDADKHLFYDAKRRLESDVRRENVEWHSDEMRKKGADEYRRWRIQLLRDKGWSEAKLHDLDIMLQADAAIRKSHQTWRKPLLAAFNADDDGTALKDAFRKKFDGEADYYSGAVASMNLYHGGWE